MANSLKLAIRRSPFRCLPIEPLKRVRAIIWFIIRFIVDLSVEVSLESQTAVVFLTIDLNLTFVNLVIYRDKC